MIVTVTPTIGDGTVVRWYHDDTDTDNLYTTEPVVSASRNGVRVNVHLHEVPEAVMQEAQDAFEALSRDHNTNLRHLATHRRRGSLFGPYEPITAEADR